MVVDQTAPRSFEKLKSTLASDCVMAHEETRATQLRVDASPVGVGAILMQPDGTTLHPVGFHSQTWKGGTRKLNARP